PNHWRISGSRQSPRLNPVGDGPPPPIVYAIPDGLKPAQFVIQQNEFGDASGAVYVITGWDGGALRPHVTRRKPSSPKGGHGTAGFSGLALGRVGWSTHRD